MLSVRLQNTPRPFNGGGVGGCASMREGMPRAAWDGNCSTCSAALADMSVRGLGGALFALLLSSCVLHGGSVGGANPQPKLHLAARGESLALQLAPEIPSDFNAPGGFTVKDFRGTL